jgi:hypothetical protein
MSFQIYGLYAKSAIYKKERNAFEVIIMLSEGTWQAIRARGRKWGFDKGFYLEQSEKPEEWIIYEHGEIPKLELNKCTPNSKK